MDKKKSKTSKNNKNRRFNTVLYIIAGILVVAGVLIILNDTTYLFACAGDPPLVDDNGTQAPVPTFPPDSDSTPVPGTTYDPAHPQPATLPPYDSQTPAPTNPSGGEWHPNPGFTHEPQPDDPVAVIFPQYAISGGRIKYYPEGAPEGECIICPVEPVGLNWKGQMATVHSALKAGWFYESGTPVKGGNTIIAGHNKYSGKLGYFSVIKDKMQPGDQVIIQMRSGGFAFYLVESVETWPHDEVPDYVMQTQGEDRLTLITCKGDYSGSLGTSRHRVIAICKPVGSGDGRA